MMNVGLDEGDDSGDEAPEKKAEYIAHTPFKELYPDSEIVRAMKEFGPNIVPLSMVGMMMNYAGNHLLHYIFTVMKRRIFYPMHKVTSV